MRLFLSLAEYKFLGGGRENSPAAAMADRFSKLPQDIIHHIMSFLPSTRDAMALSMVSKTFSSAFLCLPIIDFDLDHYYYSSSPDLKTKCLFLDSMVNYLQSRSAILFDKLRFVAGKDVYRSSRVYCFCYVIDTMFRFAIDSNVKELELDFRNSYETIHSQILSLSVPAPVLFSSTTIRVLTLIGISPTPLLQEQDLIISSPSLENLTLFACSFVASVTLLRNDKLKQVKISNCREIHVDGPTPCLEYFSCYSSSANYKLDITSSTCPKLKHLEFDIQGTLEPWIQQYNFPEFQFLETLKLFGCCNLKEIKICLQYLNTLELDLDSVDFMKVDIDAPNLVSLIYKGSKSNTTHEINMSSSSSTNLKHLQFHGENIPRRWVAHSFSDFHSLETLKLIGSRVFKNIKFHLEHLNALELYYANFMKVEIEAPSLVSLIYESVISRPPEINVSSSSTSLKHLRFKGEFVPRRWVAEDFSEFRFLETLELATHGYYQFPFNKVKFQLQCLKVLKLVICYCWELFTVEIDAPNLVSFIYIKEKHIIARDSATSFTPLLTFTSKAKPNVNLDLSTRPHENHFRNLKNFLDYRKKMVFPWKNLKHLKVESRYSHPNALSFIVDPKVNSLKFYHKNENNVQSSWQLELEKVVDKFEEGNKRKSSYFRKLWKRN